MTETPPPPSGDEQPAAGTTTTAPGVDRDHLRNYEQLRRSTTDRKIAGVAGGLGRHLNIDPTVLRVMFVVLALFSGAGIVLYLAAWLLVPEEGAGRRAGIHVDDSTRNVVLIIVGVVSALIVVGHGFAPGSWNFPWPLFLIAVLVVVWFLGRERNQRPTGPAGPGAQGPPAGMESTGYVAPPTAPGAAGPPPPWEPAGAYEYQQPYQPPYQPPKRTKTGPKLFGFTLAAVLLGLGVLGLVDASGVHVVDAAYPAVALAITGAMLVVGAFYGRPGGLIALGIVSSLALGATSAADSIDGNTDQRSYHPRSAAAVQSTYHVQSGRVVLDLSDVRDPQQLDGRTIDVSAKVGELVVTLPPGVESDVTASIDGPGGIDLPDNSTGGIDSSRSGVYGAGPDTVTINADLRAGHIEVRNP